MNYEHFLERLPALYDGWGGPGPRPRSPHFGHLLTRVRGLTSPGVLQLLNLAVACLEGDEVYAEVGCFQGATLVGALDGHPGRRACAADDFRQFDPRGHNRDALRRNLEAAGLADRVHFRDQDFEAFLPGCAAGG
jgi:hypothetical protein